MRKVKSYARFYACLNSVQTADKGDLKETLVHQFTGGRTTSLKEMSLKEYDAMCDSIDPKIEQNLRKQSEVKKARSAVLRKMQQLGVDTTDWNKVDIFCLDNRIAGKKFYELTIEELKAMLPKLIAIARKPKVKEPHPKESTHSNVTDTQIAYVMNISSYKNQLPS